MPVQIIQAGQWAVARRILRTGPVRVRAAMHAAVLQEAHFFRAKVVEGIREQAPGGRAFLPLAQSTLNIRRMRRFSGTKALLVRGDLRNSIVVESKGFARAEVGILRTARGRGGALIANIAELNEFGSRPIVIRVTAKMRRMFAMNAAHNGGSSPTGSGDGPGIMVVRIPARPFFRPVRDRYFGNAAMVRTRFLARVGTLLGGDFGSMGVTVPGTGGPLPGGAAGGVGGLIGGRGPSGGATIARGFGFLSRIFSGSASSPTRSRSSGRFRGGRGGGAERDPGTGRFRRR